MAITSCAVFCQQVEWITTGDAMSNKPLYLKISVYCFLCWLIAPGSASAQSSIIANVQKSLQSIVSVKAKNIEVQDAPPAMARDPKTGRVLVAQRASGKYYSRTGAGILIDPGGVIVTNLHTIINAHYVKVITYSGTELPAKVLTVFGGEDLAFISIDNSEHLSPITIADSDKVKLGEEIISVGNSKLLKQTISGGKIIGIGNSRHGDDDADLFQVNINVYHGDSGGPLLNKKGQLIGLMVASETRANRSSFAIPSNKIHDHYLEYLGTVQK